LDGVEEWRKEEKGGWMKDQQVHLLEREQKVARFGKVGEKTSRDV